MFRDNDSFVFQRVTGALRKPSVRFQLACGRRVELLGFHVEPAWAFAGDTPRPITQEVVLRLYPNERPVFIDRHIENETSAWLCVAYLFSDTPAKQSGSGLNYSVLLLCGLVATLDSGIRDIVSELLSRVTWEDVAADDVMW